MYAVEKELPRLQVQLTYCHIESKQTRTWARTCRAAELERRFHKIVKRYIAQIEHALDWLTCRNTSIDTLAFPFEKYRRGQREMAVGVYRAIRDHRQLLVQAATGIGKTMGTLFPAVKAIAGIEDTAILYLTARTTGRLAAQKAFGTLRAEGLRLKTLTITAKDKICFLAERSCNPDDCEYARGYFDRVDAAVESIFAADDFSRVQITATAREFRVCPFEFSLELIFHSDCVVCDYNYAFDPRVSLKRLFAESGRVYIYLVDEAHNLVDRSRDMYSAQLEKQGVLALRRRIGKQVPGLYKGLGKINNWMVNVRKQCRALADGAFSESRVPEGLVTELSAFTYSAEKWLSENEGGGFREDLLEFYFQGVNFLKTVDRYGAEYVTLLEQSAENLRVKLFCMDPARELDAARDSAAAVVFFSGTLMPAAYFKRLFGCPDDTAAMLIGSPFPDDHLGIFVADSISTLYRQRALTLKALSEILLALLAPKSGNYLFFFPSYDYLARVHAAILEARPTLHTIVQKPAMDHDEKATFLKQFQKRHEDALVGFAVLGGIFGEGIDLEGDRLSGAAVVGVGLPGVSYENELVRAYFNATEGAGYQYAYQYPGINRVLQGAGRVIRTARDRGVVLLVDQRYARHGYRMLLPRHWHPVCIRDARALAAALAGFWQCDGDKTGGMPEI